MPLLRAFWQMLICVACVACFLAVGWNHRKGRQGSVKPGCLENGGKRMFDETLKRIRKEKSMTQEELAIKVHVARQTVSKWEKGLSIPDVDLLQRIAEALDVEVSELLGAQIPKEENRNEVAEQLAKISEQMAIRNKRGNAIWKVVKALILILILIPIACWILAAIFSMTPRESKVRVEESEQVEYVVEELED